MATKRKRRPKKLPYAEGDFFVLPLKRGGWGAGLLARVDGRGGIFCYMFGPRRDEIPGLDELLKLKPSDAVLLGLAGDMGLLNQEWKLIGRGQDWDRTKWPLPRFQRIDLIDPHIAYITEYDDDLALVKETECTPLDVAGLPEDGVYGDRALGHALDKLLP